MKKDLFVTFLLALILVFGVTLLNKDTDNKKKESYFFVETPVERYSPLMSNIKGFPFTIKCNHEQIITVEITNGTLQNEKEILTEYKVSCNETIYWNEKENSEQVKIKFYSNDTSLKSQEFTLLKNKNQEFYLSR